MKKQVFLITAALLLASLLACGVPEPPPEAEDIPPAYDPAAENAEYIKLTPQEAQAMMSDDTIILDVRTREEFNKGHIKNAVLLPDYEIKEKAEDVLADKNQTVLVYCRTGRRSEAAVRALIGMGYTQVFDFGGIVDWTGEIVRD